jgi:hypothetical protein
MSTEKTEPSDYDEEFTKAVAEWRDKHRLREDDAVTFLVELFRICGSAAGVALRLRFAMRSSPPSAPLFPLADRRPKPFR